MLYREKKKGKNGICDLCLVQRRTSLKLRFKPRPRVYMTIAIRPLSTRPTSPIFWISYYNWNFDLNPLPKPESCTQIWNLSPNLNPWSIPKSFINTLIQTDATRFYRIQPNFIGNKPILSDKPLIKLIFLDTKQFYQIQTDFIGYKQILSDTTRFNSI